jgi:hypothetical protein
MSGATRTSYFGFELVLPALSRDTWKKLAGPQGRTLLPKRLVMSVAEGVSLDQLVMGGQELLGGPLLLDRLIDVELTNWKPIGGWLEARMSNRADVSRCVVFGFWGLVVVGPYE